MGRPDTVKKWFCDNKTFITILLISLLFGIGTIEFFKNVEKVVSIEPFSENITISPNFTESTVYFKINPNYFFSNGMLYAFYYSPYDAYFNDTKFYMSVDGERWNKTLYHSSMPDKKDFNNYAYVGYVDLRKPEGKIYTKKLFPPKELPAGSLPPGTSHNDVLNSTKVYLLIKRESSNYDKILELLSIITLSGFIFSILNSYFTWNRNVKSKEESK